MQVVNMDRIFSHVIAEIIRLSVTETGFDAPSSHEHREATRVMISSCLGTLEVALPRDSSTKFTTPNDQRILEESPLFQVMKQTCGRLVHIPTAVRALGGELLVMVPIGVEKLNEANPPFRQTSCEDAV